MTIENLSWSWLAGSAVLGILLVLVLFMTRKPRYRRATIMQAALAIVGLFTALEAWSRTGAPELLVGGIALGIVVPFTLVVIAPTNRRLLATELDPESAEAAELLQRWGRLHAVRSVLSAEAFHNLRLYLKRARSSRVAKLACNWQARGLR